MSVDKISVYLEAHYWILIVVFFVSLLIIIRLFVKNLNKENLEKLIKKKTLTRTSFDTKLENEESFSSSKKPFEDQFYDNSENPEVEMEMEMESIKNLDKDNLFIKNKEE